MPAQEKFAFSAIVQDKNDPLQLLAYAIYKADKFEIAEKLSANNKSSAEIDAELKSFHDAIIHSNGLRINYHTRAHNLGAALVDGLQNSLRDEGRNDFISRAEQVIKSELTWQHRLLSFFMDGLKSVAATLALIILASGIYAVSLTKEERQKFIPAVGGTVLDTLSGDIPVIDRYREILQKPMPSGKNETSLTSSKGQ